jgi:hypothetical protein
MMAPIFFFFFAGLGLELEPLHQRIYMKDFFEIGSCKLFAQAGFKL